MFEDDSLTRLTDAIDAMSHQLAALARSDPHVSPARLDRCQRAIGHFQEGLRLIKDGRQAERECLDPARWSPGGSA